VSAESCCNDEKIFGAASGLAWQRDRESGAFDAAPEGPVMAMTPTAISEATLVRRINRALADSGLRVRAARRSLAAEFGRYYFIYGARAFLLRVGIDDLARSLGILTPADSGESGTPC